MSGGNGVGDAVVRAAALARVERARDSLQLASAAVDAVQIAATRAGSLLTAAFRRLAEAERELQPQREERAT